MCSKVCGDCSCGAMVIDQDGQTHNINDDMNNDVHASENANPMLRNGAGDSKGARGAENMMDLISQ